MPSEHDGDARGKINWKIKELMNLFTRRHELLCFVGGLYLNGVITRSRVTQ